MYRHRPGTIPNSAPNLAPISERIQGEMDRPTLPRSISSADLDSTDNCTTYIERDLCEDAPRGTINFFNVTPSFSLTIPNLRRYPKEFASYVFRRLVDQAAKEELEAARVINWCKEASIFIPLSTTGDGNCLLHAASLGMWGFHDRKFTLRKAVHCAIRTKRGNSLHPRWMEWHKREMAAIGVKLERDQWAREWEAVVDSVSMEKRGGVLQGLDQFHIFVLANVLRRPIIVYSLAKIRSAAEGTTLQKLNFQGLYLPLLWDPKECKRVPLPIGFCGGHYVSLVAVDSPQQYKNGRLLLPLTDYTGTVFPVMFKLQEELEWETLRAYLDITYVQQQEYGVGIVCAEMTVTEVPKYMLPLMEGFIKKCYDSFKYDQSLAVANQTRSQGNSSAGSDSSRPNCKNGCGFFGDPVLNGYCSVCHKKKSSSSSSSSGSGLGSALRCTNGCGQPGLPDLLGMCQQCFHSKKTGSTGSGNTGGGSSGASAHTAPVDDIRPCRNPGCEFSGTKEMMFYCSQCYKKKFSNELPNTRRPHTVRQELVVGNEARPPREGPGSQHNIPRPVDEPEKCPECRQFFGSQDYGGVCYSCFMKKTRTSEPEPDKCRECGEYYGAPEFGGLCNVCFMKKTESESVDAPRPHNVPPDTRPPVEKHPRRDEFQQYNGHGDDHRGDHHGNVQALPRQFEDVPGRSGSELPSPGPQMTHQVLRKTSFTGIRHNYSS